MSSFLNIFFPTVRRSVAGLGNPAYVDDIKAANQLLVDGLAAILGMYNTNGFLIISGFQYDANLHTYAPGIFFLDGQFYYQQVAFQEGLYLKPGTQDVMPKPFSDTNARPIYTNYVSQATADPTGASPVFALTMAQYRCGIYENVTILRGLQVIASNLKDAAFRNVGNTANTVAAGNDPRLVGDRDYLDARYALQVNVILKNLSANPGDYVPIAPWDPVDKRYMDSHTKVALGSGTTHLGDADTAGGTLHTIDLDVVVPNAAYLLTFSIGSLSANHNLDQFAQVTWCNKANSTFGVWFKELQNGAQNIQLDWIAWAL